MNLDVFPTQRIYLFRDILTITTNSMEHSPSLRSSEVPRTLSKPEVHFRIHKSPPPVPIQGYINPIPTTTTNILKKHFNIIPPSTPRSSEWPLSLRFPHQNSACVFPLPRHVPYATPTSFYLIWSPGQYLVRTGSTAPHYVVSAMASVITSLLDPNTFSRTLFSKTVSPFFSLNVGDQTWHPPKEK